VSSDATKWVDPSVALVERYRREGRCVALLAVRRGLRETLPCGSPARGVFDGDPLCGVHLRRQQRRADKQRR
jgi:hypothetical protein